MKAAKAQAMEFAAGRALAGSLTVPGDKSISHRALMLSALAVGRSRITGLSGGQDVMSTLTALRAMGARIGRSGDGAWEVDGVGVGGLLQPEGALDMGNSGTSARLLMGLVASHPVSATFIGDASLSRRPMDRVIGPLRRMGADIVASPGARLPLSVRGLCPAVPLTYRLDVASAQVKSALLLAALNTPGVTRILQPVPTRNHSEIMLKAFGADIETDNGEIRLRGEAELKPRDIAVPGDPSSAAFLTVAALIVPGSEVRLEGVGVNPMRMGLYEILKRMGADIELSGAHMSHGEPVADLVVRSSQLRGIEVPREMTPSMIDEFPIFFVAAAFATGASSAHGLSELRVKESDRISAMAAGLHAIGADVREDGDGLTIRGSGGKALRGGALIHSHLDHRIAMSFAVAGLACAEPVTIDDMTPARTSFPGFSTALAGLSGA